MEEKDIDPTTIRTYESDIANAIQHRQTSQVDMVLAAEERKRKEKNDVVVVSGEKTPTKGNGLKNTLMIVASILILCAGLGIAYYFYAASPLSVKQPSNPATGLSVATASSIIVPDQQKVLDVTGLTSGGIISQTEKLVQVNPQADGGILEIVLGQQGSTTQNGKTTTALVRVTAPQFISLMNLVPPNALASTLNNQWMFGFYSISDNASGTVSSPFVILTDNFFQNAFAGMLSWEPTMPSDLSALFNLQPGQWSGGSFKDKLIKNKDAREFTDSDGNVLFLYSFIDNNTLVVAQNEAALGEIINRFESKAYVR